MKLKLDQLGEKAGSIVRENIAHLILGAVILLMIFLSFASIEAGSGKLDWFNLIINIVLQLAVFIPYRWRQKRLSGQADPYKANKEICAEQVNQMRNNNELTDFVKFCDVMTQELRREIQLEIVHNAGIDTAIYDGKDYSGLSEKQMKAIRKADRATVRPINPTCITTNSRRVKGFGVDFDDTITDAVGVMSKLLSMIVWAVVLTYIVVSSLGYTGIIVIVMIVLRVVMCLMAMLSGIMSGDGFVVKKDKAILARIDFINLFHEWKARRAPEAKTSVNLPAVIEE